VVVAAQRCYHATTWENRHMSSWCSRCRCQHRRTTARHIVKQTARILNKCDIKKPQVFCTRRRHVQPPRCRQDEVMFTHTRRTHTHIKVRFTWPTNAFKAYNALASRRNIFSHIAEFTVTAADARIARRCTGNRDVGWIRILYINCGNWKAAL